MEVLEIEIFTLSPSVDENPYSHYGIEVKVKSCIKIQKQKADSEQFNNFPSDFKTMANCNGIRGCIP